MLLLPVFTQGAANRFQMNKTLRIYIDHEMIFQHDTRTWGYRSYHPHKVTVVDGRMKIMTVIGLINE